MAKAAGLHMADCTMGVPNPMTWCVLAYPKSQREGEMEEQGSGLTISVGMVTFSLFPASAYNLWLRREKGEGAEKLGGLSET